MWHNKLDILNFFTESSCQVDINYMCDKGISCWLWISFFYTNFYENRFLWEEDSKHFIVSAAEYYAINFIAVSSHSCTITLSHNWLWQTSCLFWVSVCEFGCYLPAGILTKSWANMLQGTWWWHLILRPNW